VNQPHRFLREDPGRHAARGGQPAGDERRRFGQLERRQLAPERDPLLQLPEFRALEPHTQFGLSRQDQREQLGGRCFDVGQQPDFFEQLVAEALRFVHHERGILAHGPALLEHRLQTFQQDGLRFSGLFPEIESKGEHPHEIGGRQHGVVDVDTAHVPAAVRIERRLNQRRLARARLTGEQRQRLGRRATRTAGCSAPPADARSRRGTSGSP
jgi:hypothetical protein